MCEHAQKDSRCAECAPAPAAGHFGLSVARQLDDQRAYAPDGCPTLEQFEASFCATTKVRVLERVG